MLGPAYTGAVAFATPPDTDAGRIVGARSAAPYLVLHSYRRNTLAAAEVTPGLHAASGPSVPCRGKPAAFVAPGATGAFDAVVQKGRRITLWGGAAVHTNTPADNLGHVIGPR